MKLSEYERKQMQVLDGFYKEFFSWSAQNLGYWIGAGVMILCLGIMLLIPYQEFAQDPDFSRGILLIFGTVGTLAYIVPYVTFHEKQKPRSIYGILKNLPVSVKIVKYYRLKKLAVFWLKVGGVCLVGQLLFSLIGYHEITFGNLLYPLFYGFLFPLILGGIYLIVVE